MCEEVGEGRGIRKGKEEIRSQEGRRTSRESSSRGESER
jgi:hypothetical protein